MVKSGKMIVTQDKVFDAMEKGREYRVEEIVNKLHLDECSKHDMAKVRIKLRKLALLKFLESRYLYGKDYRKSVYKRVK